MNKIITYHFGVVFQMVEIYDSSRGLVKIGPCKWSPNLDVAFWLSRNDATILKVRGCWIKSEFFDNYLLNSLMLLCSSIMYSLIRIELCRYWLLWFRLVSSTFPPLQWLSRLTLSSTWNPPSGSFWNTLTATASSLEVSRSSTAGQQQGSGRGQASPPLPLQLLILP